MAVKYNKSKFQTGYVQRTGPDDTKKEYAKAKALAESNEKEKQKYAATLSNVEKETAAYFKGLTGVDQFALQQYTADMAAMKDFINTVGTFAAKQVIEAIDKKAEEKAEDKEKDEQTPVPVPEEGDTTDTIVKAAQPTIQKLSSGNPPELTTGEEEGGIQEISNKQAEQERIRGEVANQLGKAGYPEKEREVRYGGAITDSNSGLARFSLADEGVIAATKVKNIDNDFQNWVVENKGLRLKFKEDKEPWTVGESLQDPDKLKGIYRYFIQEWTEKNRGNANDSVARTLLYRPGWKILSKNLSKEISGIHAANDEAQVTRISTLLQASLEEAPGAVSPEIALKNFFGDVLPYLKSTNSKTKFTLGHETLNAVIAEVLRPENGGKYQDKLTELLKSVQITVNGKEASYAEHYPTKYGEQAIANLAIKSRETHYKNKKTTHGVNVLAAGDNLINTLREESKQEGIPYGEYIQRGEIKRRISGLAQSLRLGEDTYLATTEINNLEARFELGVKSAEDTNSILKAKLKANNGVLTYADVEGLNEGAVNTFLENNGLELSEFNPAEIDKEGTKAVDLAIKTTLVEGGLKGTYVPDKTSLTLSTQDAVDEFTLLVHTQARKLIDPNQGGDENLTYTQALGQAFDIISQEVKAGFNDPASKWYVETGKGFTYWDNRVVFYAPEKRSGLLDKVKSIRIFKNTGRDFKTTPAQIFLPTDDLSLDANGRANNWQVRRIARELGMSDTEFVNTQNEIFKQPVIPLSGPASTYEEIVKNNANTSTIRDLCQHNNLSSKAVSRYCNQISKEAGLILPENLTKAFKGAGIRDEFLKKYLPGKSLRQNRKLLKQNPGRAKIIFRMLTTDAWKLAASKATGGGTAITDGWHNDALMLTFEYIMYGTMNGNLNADQQGQLLTFWSNLRREGVID